jgi:hypothetical protein
MELWTTVFAAFHQPPRLPCPECGASVERELADTHVCEAERVLDFRLAQLRGEIAGFEGQLAAWLASPYGRFAAWLAERDRHGRADTA